MRAKQRWMSCGESVFVEAARGVAEEAGESNTHSLYDVCHV